MVRAGGHWPDLEVPDGDGVGHPEAGAQAYVGGVQEAVRQQNEVSGLN